MKIRFKNYIIMILLTIIIAIPLFQSNIDIYRDDGIQHVCRLMGTYQSITEGQTFPVIMSEFCNQFGYSWNLFYSPLTAYMPLMFQLVTNSFVICLKCFIIFIVALSGITMYEFLYKVTKNQYAALLGACIYLLAPYRMTDIYMRVAIAELASFAFLPLVFHGLYNIFSIEEEDKKKSGILLAVGSIGLMLSHLVIAMYVAIFAMFYVIIHIKQLKDKAVLKKLLLNLCLILCVTSFYWGPMLEHKINTSYEVFEAGRMEDTNKLLYYKSDLLDLIYTNKGDMIVEIGLVTIVGIILTGIAFSKVEKKNKKVYIFSLAAGLISIIMALKWFPFEKLPAILKMLQFSFRMFEFSSFFLAFIAAINYSLVIKNFRARDVYTLIFIILLLTVPLTKNLNYRSSFQEESLWPAVSVNDKTKRVHAGCASFEYLPSKAFDHLDYIKTRENNSLLLEGNASILSEEKRGTSLQFVIQTQSETKVELPYIYYLGYQVIIEKNGEEKEVPIFESSNGFIAINLPENIEGKVTVSYVGTPIMKLTMIISIMGITFMVLYYVRKRNKEKEE